MNARNFLTVAGAAAALALMLGSADGIAADGVNASFDRMFAHQPGMQAPVTGSDRQRDPLYRAMALPVPRGAPASAHAPASDQVDASFARMLAHTPVTAAPPVPAGFADDPLVVALVEPLRRSLSDSAAATHVATARTRAAAR